MKDFTNTSNGISANTAANLSIDTSHFSDNTVYGVYLQNKDHIVATHRDISLLRQCKTALSARPDHRIHIVAAANSLQTEYIVKTLQHLGVSCSKIDIDSVGNENEANGIWLFVKKDTKSGHHSLH